MSRSKVETDDNGQVRLTGRLTSREVPQLYRESLGWRRDRLPEVIDLEGLERADSSALALLLEWRSWAEQAGTAMRFIHVPRSLCVMASLSQIEGLLGWRTMDFDDESNGGGPCCG